MKIPSHSHDRKLVVVATLAVLIVGSVIGLAYGKALGMIDTSQLGKSHLVPGSQH